ncbi:unnamed protein product [Trifolium pratense]|uniref:Uncharacterized protein n=1 Tax=Trifolium pratense TaxID=57577 RepID=A0ACB0KTR6_TRIPR|nr:unnamed protein product [Trifolium pratense]
MSHDRYFLLLKRDLWIQSFYKAAFVEVVVNVALLLHEGVKVCAQISSVLQEVKAVQNAAYKADWYVVYIVCNMSQSTEVVHESQKQQIVMSATIMS